MRSSLPYSLLATLATGLLFTLPGQAQVVSPADTTAPASLRVQLSPLTGWPCCTWVQYSPPAFQRFELERSADGQHFERVGQYTPADTTEGLVAYYHELPEPVLGPTFYRLCVVGLAGERQYTPTKRLTPVGTTGLHVWPNPGRAGQLTRAQLATPPSAAVEWTVRDARTGRVVLRQTAPELVTNLPVGQYLVETEDHGQRVAARCAVE